jgi:hypothetical protein
VDENILDSVKTYLGIAADELGFDAEILMLINSAFSTLADVNISAMPTTMVTDNTLEWSAVPMDDGQLGNVKLYVFIEVKLAFDPPQLPAVLSSFSERKQELVWRINERAENAK